MKGKHLRIRQLLGMILCLAMLFVNIPTGFAEGSITLSTPVTVNSGNLSTYQNAVLTTAGTAKPEDSLLVFDGVKVTVVLENFKVQINPPAGHTCQSGITLKNGADVTLILRGENLAQGKYGGAGIEVPAGCKLTISSQSTGSLEAIGGSLYGGGAGIGARGNDYNYYYPENTQKVTCGDIVINGGTIRAVGATMVHQTSVIGSAAGIGGSWLSTGGTITINGGTIHATGGNFSPGIGAGSTSIVERITITGGVINSATTGSLPQGRKAAGLGAGVNSDMQTKTGIKNITITGGTIHVTGHLGLSDQSPNTVGNLDCNMQLSEDVDLTVSEKINPLGNMFQPVFSFRLEDLSIFQSVAGQLRVSDGTGNAVVEQSITLNKSGDGIFTCNISKLLYSERKGGAYNLALTVNGTTYTESFTLAESNSFTFGPGIGTAELVFRSNYLEQTLQDVTVTVKDLTTGQNVADAMVSGERKITCVGPTHGVMTLQLTPGTYAVTVTAPELNGGQPMEKEITVTKGETTTAYMLNENVVEIPEQLVLDNGNIVFGIEADIPFLSYYNDNKEQKKIYNYPAALVYVITQRSQEAIGNTITVNYGNVQMKLQGLNVSAGVPVAIQKGTAAAIKLDGTNTLTGTSGPGIHVAEDAALTLDGIGSLTVSGTKGAGIGGKHNENNGTITINGGAINATGDQFCAGIGTGGGNNDKGGRGGKITVNGGTVTAHGGRDGAGVGTGFKGSCAIEINGGSVTGTGRENAAGIGAGEYGTVTINITGGKAEGQGAERAAGIGSAYHSGASAINISGGTVIGKAWAEQGYEGAGIGGGNNADTMIITITGGTVEGYGGDSASGIGSGSDCIKPAKVYIRDGNVKGYGRQRYAAGIGGGGDGAVVEISGGTVLAEAWNYAAGIGGGDSKHAGTILISGGHVTAIGPVWDGAAIGSYIDAVGGSITITGGTVVATNDASNVPAIGGANTITISGGTVTATADRGGAGIGGAAEQPSGTINISGGVITASSGNEGAGIGAGYKGTLGEINISGGIITATGGFAAAGIGGGWRSAGGTINISGGTITATGDYNGAGVGGGYASNDMQIVITGGNIKATAGTNAQAVGNGGSATSMATVTNGSSNVYLRTITLSPVPVDGTIKSITGIPDYYGLKDMQVIDNNKIYLYLPGNPLITEVQAGDETYKGAVSNSGTLKAHVHSWSYSVSGQTITASCSNADGRCKDPNGGSVSVNIPTDRNYNGQQAELTYTGALKTADQIEISYATADGQALDAAPVDVGSYSACLRVGDKQVEGSFTISPKSVTVIADACSKTYGEEDPELTYKVEGLVGGDKLTGALKRVAGEEAGSYDIEQNTLMADDNYIIHYTGAKLTIQKRQVTITAKDQTILYGGAISNTEITAVGLIDGHRVTATLTPGTTNVTADGTITPSAAVITQGAADVTANYEITYLDGKLVIEPDTSKITGLTTDNVTSENEADIKAVQEMMENADSVNNEWNEIIATCEDLMERIEEVEKAGKEATDELAAFDPDTVKSTDKEKLSQLTEDIEALLDTQNLTDAERDALEDILAQVDDMIETIDDTAENSKAAADAIDALDPETVTSADKDKLEQAIETIDGLLTEDHLTEAERKELTDAKAEAEALIAKIDAAAEATDTDATQKVENVTAENVKPEDKQALEDAKADLEKALEENSGNYTEEEKTAIEEQIDRIEDAITALENAEKVTDVISQLPESVEPDDEAEAEKILAALEAYEALTDHEKSLVSEDAREKLDDLVAALTAYDIVEGDGSSWTRGSNSALSFTANGAFRKFVGIQIDGVDVDKADYEAEAGSTIITLTSTYLESLKTGKHKITVLYNDGSAEGTFRITAKSSTPATGDDFNIALHGSALVVSVTALVVLLLLAKKKKYA